MAKSSVREKIKMVSTGTTEKGKKTGYYYTTHKNKRNTPDKMILRKFDPRAWNPSINRCGMVVDFKEDKIK